MFLRRLCWFLQRPTCVEFDTSLIALTGYPSSQHVCFCQAEDRDCVNLLLLSSFFTSWPSPTLISSLAFLGRTSTTGRKSLPSFFSPSKSSTSMVRSGFSQTLFCMAAFQLYGLPSSVLCSVHSLSGEKIVSCRPSSDLN